MTGAQLLDELRNSLETNLESIPADSAGRERGWAGEDGDVVLPRAPGVGGGEASGPDAEVRITIQRPSAQRAGRERRVRELEDRSLWSGRLRRVP